jgi:hypothetical protein
MSMTEAVKSSKEYMNLPIAELVESSTNPRKVFGRTTMRQTEHPFSPAAATSKS